VTRQVAHAREYARRKGWFVPDEFVFIDDGISGVEFAKRPGLLRLLRTLKPRAPFHFLIMSEESRLGREQIEVGWILKQIIDAGVRVFFYLEDRERTLDSAMDKMMMSLTNFAAEVERERASQRTHDAMIRKAKAGHVTGGRVYGYDNREIVSSTLRADGRAQRQYVVRQINAAQAAVVRRIYTLYASGIGITRIAKLLNDEGATPPRQDRNGWAPTAIREILLRPLYRGEIVYNRTQKISKAGTKMQRKRPESDWHRLNVPDLRVIAEDLWEAVRRRFERNHAAYPRRATERCSVAPLMLTVGSSICSAGSDPVRRAGGRSSP
jgi:DNA invertase Pin-like site-specific DNA recombinase